MDAWIESLALAIVVVAAGVAALGSRGELWPPAAVAASGTPAALEVRCVALHAGPLAHQPKCATAATPLAANSSQRLVLRGGD